MVRACRPKRRYCGEGQVEVADRAVGAAHGQPVVASTPAGEHDPAVREQGVAGRTEPETGHPDLGVDLDDGLDPVAGRPAVEVPPVAAVGQEQQRAVGLPAWLGHRLARPTRDNGVCTGREIAHSKHGVVPRHRRVVPADPGQAGPVRVQSGGCHEVRAGDQQLRWAVTLYADDLVAHVEHATAARRVTLTHRDEHPAGPGVAVGVPVPARDRGHRRDRNWRDAGIDTVKPLIGPVREPHNTVSHPPRRTAVLVHRGPGVHPVG
ncbi:MAG TPA: hypothetical protein VE196_11345 [Pseudonocardiaceae bacterium]|nr:hypothetical protein [Pseudonocardiaceae bacterium]